MLCHADLVLGGQCSRGLTRNTLHDHGVPYKYLGIPLPVKKLPKRSLQPLVNVVHNRMSALKGKLKTMVGGGLGASLVGSLLQSPVHLSIALRLLD